MRVLVATVAKPHGIKGELKLNCHLDQPSQMKNITHLYLGERALKIKSVRTGDDCVYVLFESINTRNDAEMLRNWDLYADREEIVLPEDKFLIADLIGSAVFLDDGTFLGHLKDVLQYGAADVFVVEGEKTVQFPFLKDLVIKTDTVLKTIHLRKKRFLEVCLYED